MFALLPRLQLLRSRPLPGRRGVTLLEVRGAHRGKAASRTRWVKLGARWINRPSNISRLIHTQLETATNSFREKLRRNPVQVLNLRVRDVDLLQLGNGDLQHVNPQGFRDGQIRGECVAHAVNRHVLGGGGRLLGRRSNRGHCCERKGESDTVRERKRGLHAMR